MYAALWILLILSAVCAAWIFVELVEDFWDGLAAKRFERQLRRDLRFKGGNDANQ